MRVPPSPYSLWRFGDGRCSFVGRARPLGSARAWVKQLRWSDGAVFIIVDERL